MTVDLTAVNSADARPRRGAVIHWAGRYDMIVWLLTLGRERSFRERLIALASLQPGEAVLDVGCGTGTLAILASRLVGPSGTVHGVDPSPEMIARATKKAASSGAEIAFRTGYVQELPYRDGQFDAVLSTLMMHHLPRADRKDCVREIRRVLKPGGRTLVVDFGARPGGTKNFIGHLHHRRGHVELEDVIDNLKGEGLTVVESGPVGTKSLYFALAERPAA